jgi:Membrane GTPase LepA
LFFLLGRAFFSAFGLGFWCGFLGFFPLGFVPVGLEGDFDFIFFPSPPGVVF